MLAKSLDRLPTFNLHYSKTCSLGLFIFLKLFLPFVHPLSFSINHFYTGATNILYEGDAVPTFLGFIELNRDIPERVGRATYAKPLHLWDSTKGSVLANFTTNFSFIIDTRNRTVFSDGLVFFLAPFPYPIPPNTSGADLGLFNYTTRFEEYQNKIVMVEFDTGVNKEWDPPWPHVGININTISSVVNASWNASSNSGKMAHVRITYNATTMNLSVFWTYEQNPADYVGNATSSLSYHIDLRTVLPEWVTIGFSAATGLFGERHAIYTWDFSSDLEEIYNKKKERRPFLIGVIALSVFVLMVGVAICWLVFKKWRKRIDGLGNISYSITSTDLERQSFPRRFAYQELVAATNGFANDKRLGQGGSGQVYKGILQDIGCAVAVKRIFAESEQYEKVFINEVKIISRLIHRNLVQFIGWCHEQGECLLVYAYMHNSSLDKHLFGSRTTLQWDFRYKIALGLASALHYLHEDVEQCVLHRDIKSANVLLDKDFSTKLGDFGIAKLVDPRFRTQTTGVVGTFGYMAPEYVSGGRASKESDMFSFGVVALEIACGRRTYQDEGGFHVPLVKWVWQLYLTGNLLNAADESLNTKFDPNEMECLLIVGLWCTHPNNHERPKAGQVIKVLQLEAPLPELPHDMPRDMPDDMPGYPQDNSSQVFITTSLNVAGR